MLLRQTSLYQPTHTWGQCYAHFWPSILPRQIYHKMCPRRIIQIISSTLAALTSLRDTLRWPVPSSIRTFLNNLHHFLPCSALDMPSSYTSINRWWISMGEVLRVTKLSKSLPLHFNLAHEGHLTLALFSTLLLLHLPLCTENKMLVEWKIERLDRDTDRKRSFGRTSRRWDENFKTVVKQRGAQGVN